MILSELMVILSELVMILPELMMSLPELVMILPELMMALPKLVFLQSVSLKLMIQIYQALRLNVEMERHQRVHQMDQTRSVFAEKDKPADLPADGHSQHQKHASQLRAP